MEFAMKKVFDKGLQYWLPYYLCQKLFQKKKTNLPKPVHILLCVVDHFEPFNGFVNYNTALKRVEFWKNEYPKLAERYRDADNRPLQHTWFYPPHLDNRMLPHLVELCQAGYGEVEMHLHHNHMEPFPDTSKSLQEKILRCINDYGKYGIFAQPNGLPRFGFIHGDWSLNNSRGGKICGVNNEITILKECGCYADFTFPSPGEAQPAMVNKIYYAKDDPNKPKSYNYGKELIVGGSPSGDLLMIPGIIGLRWKSRTHRFTPSIEASNLDKSDYPFPERIDYWIKNSIKIKGREEWLFIKLHTHGAREETWESLLGERADKMYSYLQYKYNDGVNFLLHYVTARELYNIAKAAESGNAGNPNNFRDYEISKYKYC
jgi:hypothetical protein